MIKLGYSGVKNKPFVVLEDYGVLLSNGDEMIIPRGYLTDYASVPTLLKLFLNHISNYGLAFIVHDYLYNFRGYKLSSDSIDVIAVSRIFADKEMKYQMLKMGSENWRANLYYWAVRLFGWRGFGKI